jgi:hypothetical protein
VRVAENSLRYCVTALNEPIPDFSKEEVNDWIPATDTLRIGLQAGPVRGAGPKTAVQVPKLREILGASETYTVQRREGFTGSYTITAPSFMVVGEARFYPLTPLHPPVNSSEATESSSIPPVDVSRRVSDAVPGIMVGNTATKNTLSGRRNDSSSNDAATPFVSPEQIAHAYPHYDVERGFFPDPLRRTH